MRAARVIAASAAGFLGFCLPLEAQDQLSARASFLNPAGEPTGTGTVTAVGEGVLIEMEVHGLPINEWVALHVHETGECDPDTAYESAGEHFNPTDAQHGYRSDGGPHVGDLPNQYVDEKGFLRAQIFSNFLTLGGSEPDIRGKALIVHAAPDDYETQPSGGAGDRESPRRRRPLPGAAGARAGAVRRREEPDPGARPENAPRPARAAQPRLHASWNAVGADLPAR